MRDKVKAILCEVKDDPNLVTLLDDSTDLVNTVGLDSLQMINMFLRLEEEFGLEIDFENFDFDLLASLGAFCDYIESLCGGSHV